MTSNEDEAIFTPLMPDGSRAYMSVSREDRQQIFKGQMWFGVVTDMNTGRHYEVEGAECSQPRCYCDAVVLREIPNRASNATTDCRRIETRIAGLMERIARIEASSASLKRFPATKMVNGVKVDVTDDVLDLNAHTIGEMMAQANALRAELSRIQAAQPHTT